MIFAWSARFGIQQQRGFWLRCFLGRALGVILLGSWLSRGLLAQVDVPGPMQLARAEGVVVNTFGKPVVNAEITLAKDDTVVYRTRTDNAGRFHFEHAIGHFWFRVARTDNAPAVQEVIVGDLVTSYLERKKLYVIVGPGACTDACSSVFSNKHQFDRAIRNLNKH